MKLKPIKLVLCILSIFLILNFSCKSTGSTSSEDKTPVVPEVPEPIVELPMEIPSEFATDEVTEETPTEDTATEEITEALLPAEEELNDLFVEELIVGIIEDFPEKTKPELELPVVAAVTPPPAPAVPPAPAPIPSTPAELELPAEETAPPPAPSRNYPDYPATRLDSLAQMGRTPLDTEIIYSRIVRATVGQTVEIPFRGNGWVYLGETASRRGIVYNSRRNESEGQSFIFSLEEAGVYTLRFYRQDFIRDFIINDHVQVIVADAQAASSRRMESSSLSSPTEGRHAPQSAEAGWFSPPADRGKVIAQPRWPSPLEEAQIRSGARLPSEPVVTAEPTPSASARSSATPRASSQPAAADRSSAATNRPSSTTAQSSTTTQPTATAAQTPAAAQQSSTIAAQSAASRQSAASQPDSQTTNIASVVPQIQETSETIPARTREVLAPEVLLERAEKSFEDGKVDEAILFLNYFLEDYPSGSDELYWLLGQYYEANSPSRNILLSIDYYKRLVNEYPQSRRLNDARKRIAYLERFYINIQ